MNYDVSNCPAFAIAAPLHAKHKGDVLQLAHVEGAVWRCTNGKLLELVDKIRRANGRGVAVSRPHELLHLHISIAA